MRSIGEVGAFMLAIWFTAILLMLFISVWEWLVTGDITMPETIDEGFSERFTLLFGGGGFVLFMFGLIIELSEYTGVRKK